MDLGRALPLNLLLASRNLFRDRIRLIATLVGIVFSVVLKSATVAAESCSATATDRPQENLVIERQQGRDRRVLTTVLHWQKAFFKKLSLSGSLGFTAGRNCSNELRCELPDSTMAS